MTKLRKITYFDKEIKLVEPVKIEKTAHTFEVFEALDKAWKKDRGILNILKKYAKNDGWSDGWTIEFWNMKPRELNKVVKFFTQEDKSE